MKKISFDTYSFKSLLKSDFLNERLRENTLLKDSLTMVITDKDFIGRINDNKFMIFSSSFVPYGALCILNGEITENSEIKITTLIHKPFLILFYTWLILVTLAIIFLGLHNNQSIPQLLSHLSFIIIPAFLFRLFLHVSYLLARNNAIKRLTLMLSLQH